MKGISTFGKAAELTAHNAFVRINTNRALAGMPALESAPVYTSDVPEVDYDDFWVTPDRIIFVGLNQPSEHHRLVVKMSQTTSTGVSSGWNSIVIITPAFSPDWGDADITEAYIDRIGFSPVPGQKYFLSFWWLPLSILQNTTLIAVNQLFINFCLVTQNQRGTKTGQNHGKIKSRTLCPKYPLWNTSVSFAKVRICPLKNEGKSLFLSFTTRFPTIVPQMRLLQAVLTSNGMVCKNRVLNFVLHSVGHFQKRELAIEPKICHPYCPILGFGSV